MYGREVTLDGAGTIFVPCTPSTPDWEVLQIAAKILKARHEQAAKDRTR
jgi:hypothetical protein